MRYLSVCSGIEAATVAWHPLGWQCAGVAEIEAFPRAVLQQRIGAAPVDFDDHRWTEGGNTLPLFGDFTRIEEHHVGPVDLLVGGTPCQSFSIAGKRLGLDDPRGNLTLEFLALARRVRPRWLVWENVPGVLSHDGGRTFGTFLGLLAECGFERWAYRVLDAQYVRVGGFGRAVPQRRRRVFVIGYSGAGNIHPRAVLFDRESLCGNPAPRREAGEGTSADVAPSLVSSGQGVERCGETRGQDPVIAHAVAPTLNAAFGAKLGLEDQHIRGGQACSSSVAMCLNAGAMGRRDAETETLIPMRGGGFDDAYAIQAGATRENPNSGPDGVGVQANIAYTLESRSEVQMVAHSLRAEGFDAGEDGTGRDTPLVPVAYRTTGNDGAYETGDHVAALTTGTDPNSHVLAFDTTQITSPANRSSPKPGDPCHTLAAGDHPPAIAHNWRVRRLTPTECARLQGFPDDWARIEWRGKPADQCPDGPQYKAYGNSMAVNVMRWIGERIAAVDAIAACKDRAA